MPQRLPRLTDPVLYRPRVPYGRQSELAGEITLVHNPEVGDVDLIVFSASGEPQRISHAIRKSDKATVHCWEFTGLAADVERLEFEVAELRSALSGHTVLGPPARPKTAARG